MDELVAAASAGAADVSAVASSAAVGMTAAATRLARRCAARGMGGLPPLGDHPAVGGRTRVVGWLWCPARFTGSTGTRHRSEPLLLPKAVAAQCLDAKDVEVA